MHTANIPILGHLICETMAALSFLLQPRMQLQDPEASEEAVLICHSYAGSLFTTDLLCFLFLFVRGSENFDDASAMVAGSLAVYHVFPIRRAGVRIRKRNGKEVKFAGGPWMHLSIHSVLLVSLVWAASFGRSSSRALA